MRGDTNRSPRDEDQVYPTSSRGHSTQRLKGRMQMRSLKKMAMIALTAFLVLGGLSGVGISSAQAQGFAPGEYYPPPRPRPYPPPYWGQRPYFPPYWGQRPYFPPFWGGSHGGHGGGHSGNGGGHGGHGG